MPRISGSFSRSCDSTVTTTCTLVLEALDEERADRTVDETRGQRLLLGRTAFTLEVAAGNLAGGVRALLVVHGEREEIDAGLRGLLAPTTVASTLVSPYWAKTAASAWRAIVAGLELQLAPAPFNFHAMNVEHVRSFVFCLYLSVGLFAASA